MGQGEPWPRNASFLAALKGHLHILEWIQASDFFWDDEGICTGAAVGGQLGVLQWA